jgi:hypothetical protein
MDDDELTELLNSPEKLYFMNELLKKYQFPEYFLIKTVSYYESKRCLDTQWNLSPYFCFRYLYNNDTDSSDDWTDYHDVFKYLISNDHSPDFIHSEYIRAINDRNMLLEKAPKGVSI